MTKEEAISMLQRNLNDGESIILAYWQQDTLPNVKEDEWEDFADYTEDNMDWSNTHEQIQDGYDFFKS